MVSKFKAFTKAFQSWNTAVVSLESYASGLPLGLVLTAIPDWSRSSGFDLRLIGLLSLTQLPWAIKLLWAPWVDTYDLNKLGRGRSWILVTQIGLALSLVGLAALGHVPSSFWFIFGLSMLIAFLSATQDIALDGYTVQLLEKNEQAVAVGSRIAIYRAAMYVAGGLSITYAAKLGWPAVYMLLAATLLPMILLTINMPAIESHRRDPETYQARTALQNVSTSFVQLLSRPRAFQILAFVILYKLSDNLSQALLRPFLVDQGYNSDQRGFALATVGLVATLVGTFLGGVATPFFGLVRSLWIFGLFQIFSNIGYVFLATVEPNTLYLCISLGIESLTQGLGTGAFSVLLIRLTSKRFSMTQYAVLSSLFSLPRMLCGPLAAAIVHAIGWKTFFYFTMVAGLPGLWMLWKFAPLGKPEPEFELDGGMAEPRRFDMAKAKFWFMVAFIPITFLFGSIIAILEQLKDSSLSMLGALQKFWIPGSVASWVELCSIGVIGLIFSMFLAAYVAADREV